MKVTRDGRRITVGVTPDGEGLVSHAGSALLAQVAERTGLTRALSSELAGLKERRSGHDLGRVVRDLAVMLAGGGDCLADLGAVRDQQALFGAVASGATAFRVIDRIASDPAGLERLRAAHARARAQTWKLTGAPQRLTIDLDATLLGSHSDKEGAAGNFKGGFGFTRCSPTPMRPARRSRVSCGRATPARTPPPTRSPLPSRRSSRSPPSTSRTSSCCCAWTPPGPVTSCSTGRGRPGSGSRSAMT